MVAIAPIVWRQTLAIGRDADGVVTVIAEVRQTRGLRDTVTHDTITDPLEFALTYETPHGGGAGVHLLTPTFFWELFISPETLRLWAALAGTWHLNTLRPNCEHQPRSLKIPAIDPGQHYHTEYRRVVSALAPCSHGYVYGSDWLVQPLPETFLTELDALAKLTQGEIDASAHASALVEPYRKS